MKQSRNIPLSEEIITVKKILAYCFRVYAIEYLDCINDHTEKIKLVGVIGLCKIDYELPKERMKEIFRLLGIFYEGKIYSRDALKNLTGRLDMPAARGTKCDLIVKEKSGLSRERIVEVLDKFKDGAVIENMEELEILENYYWMTEIIFDYDSKQHIGRLTDDGKIMHEKHRDRS